jgi:hypothetical protein
MAPCGVCTALLWPLSTTLAPSITGTPSTQSQSQGPLCYWTRTAWPRAALAPARVRVHWPRLWMPRDGP